MVFSGWRKLIIYYEFFTINFKKWYARPQNIQNYKAFDTYYQTIF